MTVKELIEALEEFSEDLIVIENGTEITDVLIRDELYFAADNSYKEDQVVKVI